MFLNLFPRTSNGFLFRVLLLISSFYIDLLNGACPSNRGHPQILCRIILERVKPDYLRCVPLAFFLITVKFLIAWKKWVEFKLKMILRIILINFNDIEGLGSIILYFIKKDKPTGRIRPRQSPYYNCKSEIYFQLSFFRMYFGYASSRIRIGRRSIDSRWPLLPSARSRENNSIRKLLFQDEIEDQRMDTFCVLCWWWTRFRLC